MFPRSENYCLCHEQLRKVEKKVENLSSGLRLLSGEAMVAPLAERLDIPYPATDKSCGRVEASKDEGLVG